MHFSSILTLAGTVALAAAAPSKVEKRANNFQFFGVSESGAEFGEKTIPGTLGKEYIWPETSAIDVLNANGMNTFRVAFLMERLVLDKLTGEFDAAYLADLKKTVSHITGKGAYAVLDPHNYARYYGEVITDVAGFNTWWTNVATIFKDNDKVIFDCNNEPHTMPSIDLVIDLNQACINGVRAAGATSQYIFVEGTAWSGAWSWTTTSGNTALSVLTDPEDKIVYEMHQYLDSDSSGTNEVCVSSTIGVERVKAATEWLRKEGKKGLIGEFAGGPNDQCKEAVEGLLAYLFENSDVWTGALWWAAGPWWDTYMFSMEAPNGKGFTYYMDTLKQYAGNGEGSGPAPPSGTVAPTATAPEATATTSAPVNVDPVITATSTKAAAPTGDVQAVVRFGQCGGKGFTGSTVCVTGSTCKVSNEYYSQCL